MAIYTKYYQLAAFGVKERYSGSKDQSRFRTIDNQLSFLSYIVGDGIITGWDVSDATQSQSLMVSVSPGMGLISGFITRTFVDILQKIEDNSTVYLYMQKKLNYLGGFGGYSNIASIIYSDSIPPPVPSYMDAILWDYDYVSLLWDNISESEPDFSAYRVYRSEDGFATEALIKEISSNSYIDVSVEEDTSYEYRVTSVDNSGNESLPSVSTGIITTLKDLISPLDPTYVLIFPGDGFIDVMWKAGASGKILEYEIKTEELDNGYNAIGTVSSYTVPESVSQYKVTGLSNGTFYRVTIYSVSKNGVNSSGISVVDAPKFNLGPAEVDSISMVSEESLKNEFGIKLKISWIPGSNSYNEKTQTYRHVVTLIENGYTVSDPFYIYNTNELDVELFFSDGSYNPIKQKTDYIVKIEAEDERGNLSNGVVARKISANFQPPYVPTSLSYYIDDNSNLIFSWQNSSSNFSYNLLNLTRKDATSLVVTTLENNTNYGKKSIYRIENVDIALNSIYELSLQSIDEDSLSSAIVKTTYISPNTANNYISAPTGLSAYSGDGSVMLSWEKVTSVVPKYYKIWRADYLVYGLKSSLFSLVDIISSEFNMYQDMSVVNGGRYFYFVTTVDIYNRESKNPVNNNYSSYALAFGYAKWDETFIPIENLSAVASGYDVIVSWDTSTDSFDGYEIYRYAPTSAVWEKIGHTGKEFGVFIDENALVLSGDYHYIVRKFRNESQLIVSSSSLTPVRSLLLAKITSQSGSMTIDASVAQHLGNLEKVATDYVNEVTPLHRHELTTTYDRRVDLRRDVIVGDWTTIDNQTFITSQDISGAISFIPFITDTTISYEVNKTDKTIIFSKNIGTNVLSVQCLGLEEVDGILSSDRTGDISATQIYSGKIPKEQLEGVDHSGYVKHPLIPLQMPMSSDDGYLFTIDQNTLGEIGSLGSAITFYDIIKIQDGSFVAATSSGIVSNSTGTWIVIFQTDMAPHKIFYADSIDEYFAITGKSIYISADGLTWVKCNGLDDVHVIRDIEDDSNGNVYATTDKGVYLLNVNSDSGLYLRWEQTSFINEESSNTYALLFNNNRLYVSCDNGLYYTDNSGVDYYESNEIISDDIIRLFYVYGDYTFALTDTSIWRKYYLNSSFTKIADFDADVARKMVIFEDRIIVSTDFGLYVSSSEEDVFSDIGLTFDSSLKKINFTGKTIAITGLSVTGTSLNIGTDCRLYSGDLIDSLELVYSDLTSIIPSVYVDNQLQVVGFTYYNVDNTIWFDDFVSSDKKVTVANQYQLFKVMGQGWLDKKYAAEVVVYKDGTEIATMTGGDFVAYAPFDQVVFDTFTEFDSNYEKAIQYQAQYITKLEEMREAYTSGITELQLYASDLVDLYNKTYSQVIGNVRFASTITVGATGSEINYAVVDYLISPLDIYTQIFSEYELVPHITPIPISDANTIVSANITDGFFEFVLPQNKYDEILVDIKNTAFLETEIYTHKEIEDYLEEINSGLSLALSETQQANIIKTSLFFERIWSGEQTGVDQCNIEEVSPYKMNYFIPTTNSWYDVLNSSVDYKKEIILDDIPISIDYVTAVLYAPNSSLVFVGTPKGLVSISTIDLSMSQIDFNGGREEFIRDIQMIGSTIYIITNDNIYTSVNDGYDWQREEETPGLTGSFKAIGKIGDNFIVTTTDGVFYRSSYSTWWSESVMSTVNQSTIDALLPDLSNPNLLVIGTYAVAIKNGNQVFYSKNGIAWEYSGEVANVRVNASKLYKKILLLGTDMGLRLDNSTFYTKSPATSLVDVLGDLPLSEGISINDISINPLADEYVAGASNGNYYMWDGTGYTEVTTTLRTIQKTVCVEGDYWLFGYDMLKIASMAYAIKLSAGVPL